MTEELLPQSRDAERALISSFLIDPSPVGRLCAERRIHAGHFATPAHATIYAELMTMWGKDAPIDFILLTQVLKDTSRLEECGGAVYITELFTLLPTAANAARYIDVLGEKLILRQIITTCHEFGSRSQSEQDQVSSLVGEIQERVAAITNEVGDRKIPTMKENVVEAISFLEGRLGDCKEIIRTGLKGLDVDLGPLERGNLFVIAGQTKSGKSVLASQIAMNMALDGWPVLFISLEMSERELTLRMLSSLARVDIRRVREWTEAEYARVAAAQGRLAQAPIHIATYRNDLAEVSGVCQQLYTRYAATERPLAAVFLDYAQLCRVGGKTREDRRQQEIAEISRTCKRIAGKLNVLFVALSQLNEEGRTREGRDLENDANAMVEVGHDKETGWRGVRVALARSAPMGQLLPIRIIPEHTRAEDCDLTEEDEPTHEHKRKEYRHSRKGSNRRWDQD